MTTAPDATLARHDAEAPLPRRYGRLSLLRLIARGGMGEVFLATWGGIEGAERPCVVKVIRREHVKDPSFVARFLDEARVQSQLSHPGVAQVLEAALDAQGQPYVVVEHIEGRSLAEVRSRAVQMGTKIAWADAVAMAASVSEALAHVHERFDVRGQPLGIAHRDLSPQNVMIGFDGETKLIDFGTARGANRRSRTVAGVVYAKPGYVAPEVANGIPGDASVDVYALGVMLWEVCSGRRFLQGDAGEHMAAVGQNRRALPPIAEACSAPRELDEVLGKMTAHDKAQRLTGKQAQGELIKLIASAPSLSNGERGVRARIATLLAGLYPSEPKRSRAEFAKLVAQARRELPEEIATPIREADVKSSTAPTLDPDMIPGTRYRVVRTLGEGAGGTVFEAVHVDLARRVALKVLSPERAQKPIDAARFRREAVALSKLSHKSVARLYDFGIATDGRMVLAMEYVEGETLEKVISREKAMSLADALRITKEVAIALEALHAAELVHRDVKPSNLLVATDGSVRLLDFGLATPPGEIIPGEKSGGTLSIFGTPEYMAPEQIDGERPLDGRADVYALGSVLYELVTGRMPFAGSTSVAVLHEKRRNAPEAPSLRAPGRKIPAHIDALVMRALARNPDLRFGSVTEFREAIERAETSDLTGTAKRRFRGAATVAVVMGFATLLLGGVVVHKVPAARAALHAGVVRYDPFHKKPHVPISVPIVASAEVTAIPEIPEPPPPAPNPVLVDLGEPSSEDAAPPQIDPAVREAAPAPVLGEQAKDARTKAKRALSKKKWRLARRWAEVWMQTDKSPEPQLVLARALASSGHVLDAREVLSAVLESHPTCDEARELAKDMESHKAAPKRSRGAVAMVKPH